MLGRLFLYEHEMIARSEKRFARDAAHVQTGAAQFLLFLDKACFQSELTGADGGNITSRSGPDDYNVKFFHEYLSLSIRENNRTRNCIIINTAASARC